MLAVLIVVNTVFEVAFLGNDRCIWISDKCVEAVAELATGFWFGVEVAVT